LDDHTFAGTYILKIEDNKELFNFWVQQRGRSFATTSLQWGVNEMFGADAGNNHTVLIETIDYEVISPIFRQVEIKLIRQGD